MVSSPIYIADIKSQKRYQVFKKQIPGIQKNLWMFLTNLVMNKKIHGKEVLFYKGINYGLPSWFNRTFRYQAKSFHFFSLETYC